MTDRADRPATVGLEPVAVTGYGCVCAAGRTLAAALDSMFRGWRDPRPPTGFVPDQAPPALVFEVPDAWLSSGQPLSGRQRCAALARTAAAEALAAAGLTRDDLQQVRGGVCLGTVVGASMDDEAFYGDLRRGGTPSVAPVLRFLGQSPALRLQRDLRLTGPAMTVTTACTSGAVAIAEAAAWIRAGLCDVALAGGVDRFSRLSYDGFASLMIADHEPCRPFDRRRRGINLGEGAGILVLEREAHALARRAPVRGRVLGDANTCDAYHLAQPDPTGASLRRALLVALARSGVAADAVAFVNAHGTGTIENDHNEGQVLGACLPGVPFGSTKGYTGHTLGAAGAIEAVFTLACHRLRRIPASIGFAEPDPAIGVSPVTAATEVRGRAAVSISVGYGGNNEVLVLEGNG